VLFSPLGYPGYTFRGFIPVNMYTAPALASLIGVTVVMLTMLFLFEEHYSGIVSKETKKGKFFVLPKFDGSAIAVCLFIWLTVSVVQTNVEAILTPYTMIMYNWDDQTAIRNTGYLILISGTMSSVCYVIYAFTPVRKLDERKATLIGLAFFLSYHLITFPWPFYPGAIDYQISDLHPAHNASLLTLSASNAAAASNVTARGCDVKYSWCRYTPKVPVGVLFGAYDTLIAIGWVPIMVPMSVLYSRILGPRLQGTMQGLLAQTGSFARTIAPLLMTWLFSSYGPRWAWGLEILLLSSSMIAVFVFYKKLVPLKTVDAMKCGDAVRYKRGVLYKL